MITVGIFVNSCSSDDGVVDAIIPEANFSYDEVTGSPQIVSFINTSNDAERYEWNFGDGSEVSIEKHPSHVYKSGGTYNVVLKAINQENESRVTQQITVYGNPIADFNYEADSETTYKVNFQNLSQNTTTYTWDFGDGSGISNEENPSYTYSSKGMYTVTLTSEGNGGSNFVSMDVEVTDILPPYSNIYIVGDASPSGWNIASPEAFTQDHTDPFVFVYEGLLTPGALKISTFTGDWCDGNWINSQNDSDDLTGTSYIVTSGCDGPDNKWAVTSENEGNYIITVNLKDETIRFELQ